MRKKLYSIRRCTIKTRLHDYNGTFMGLCCVLWWGKEIAGKRGGRQIARVAKLSYNVQDYVVYAASPSLYCSSSTS